MKIGIVSDLHLEFEEFTLTNDENVDVLILAGDVCVASHIGGFPFYDDRKQGTGSYREELSNRYLAFFEGIAKEFPRILYVAGNHEHYKGYYHKTTDILRKNLKLVSDRFEVLEMDTVSVNEVVFMGGTLWTDLNNGCPLTEYTVGTGMSDFNVITFAAEIPGSTPIYRKFRPMDSFGIHRKTFDYFSSVLRNSRDSKVVMISHHAPSNLSIDERYVGHKEMNGGYASELFDRLSFYDNLVLAVHGHVHCDFDYTIGNTRVVCNPRGYPNERKDQYKMKVVEV